MPIDPPGEVPFKRIAEYLRGLVEAAQPGDKLPSQAKLQERFHVHHQTVMRAYEELVKEGLVEAVRYKGYYVRDRFRLLVDRTASIHPGRIAQIARDGDDAPVDTWGQAAAAAGYAHRQDIRVETVFASTRVGPYVLADLMACDPDTTVTARLRTRYIGPDDGDADQPESLANTYYAEDIVGGTPIARPASVNTLKVLAELGHAIVSSREEVWPRMAVAAEISALRLPEVTAVVDIIRTSSDDAGAVVFVQHIVTPNPLVYDLQAGDL